jgi:hypothetical protein
MDAANILGFTKGVVIDTDDPAGMHRVRVRIPSLHGAMTEEFYPTRTTGRINRVEDKYLPWAEVLMPYNTLVFPEINQVVLVGFIGASTAQPVVLGWLGYEYTASEEPLVIRK